MIKKILKSLFITTLLGANLDADIITINKGWNLVGNGNYSITVNKIFDSKTDKHIVWYYNNTTTQWSAYSNDIKTANIINNSTKITPLEIIEANSGYWVYNIGEAYSINNQDETVIIKSLVSNKNINISFDKIDDLDIKIMPTTMYIKIDDNSNNIGMIKYHPTYENKNFNIIYNNTLYSGSFSNQYGDTTNSLTLNK
jgi:hypothetical protein